MFAPPALFTHELQARPHRLGHGRRQRRRIYICSAALDQGLDERRLARHERAENAKGLAERAHEYRRRCQGHIQMLE